MAKLRDDELGTEQMTCQSEDAASQRLLSAPLPLSSAASSRPHESFPQFSSHAIRKGRYCVVSCLLTAFVLGLSYVVTGHPQRPRSVVSGNERPLASLWGLPGSQPAPAQPAGDRTACQFVVGNDGANACPTGAVKLDETECRNMPYHFGGLLHLPFVENRAQDPAGCFFYNAQYYFNAHAVGGPSANRKVYCKICQQVPQTELGDWSEWGSGASLALARKVSSRFRKIATGTCKDLGWYAIRSKTVCEEAASYLGLLDKGADFTNFAGRPDGCYYFRNYQDTTETLWMNVNEYSKGNGAETSALASGGLRQPVCSAEDTTATSAEGPGAGAPAPSGPTKFRKLNYGACGDIGFLPILDADSCEAASRYLGLVDVSATTMSLGTKPEGCYYFWNSHDLTTTLWLNTSPLSRGNGAQETTNTQGGHRTPLCKAADAGTASVMPAPAPAWSAPPTMAPYVAPAAPVAVGTIAPAVPAWQAPTTAQAWQPPAQVAWTPPTQPPWR